MTTETAARRKMRTITLTGRPPVRIADDDWPALASASYHEYDGQYDFQANEHDRGVIKVRQHADGRAIVYATASYETAWQGRSEWDRKAGELLPADAASTEQIIAAIGRVHATMAESIPADGELWAPLRAECIADLPAEEL